MIEGIGYKFATSDQKMIIDQKAAVKNSLNATVICRRYFVVKRIGYLFMLEVCLDHHNSPNSEQSD